MAHQRYSEHIYMKPEVNSNRFEISNCFEMSFCLHGNLGQVDSMEFAELAESAENHNFLSFLIKQPKNYPWTYSDTFSLILSVKNNFNSIFLQFRVFVCGPIPKHENAEFAEVFKKFIKFTEPVLDSGCTAQIDHLLPMFIYTADYFSNLLLSI